MDAFPAFFPLAGKTVVIVGEGEPAEAKARLFAGAPATVVRVAVDRALEPDAYAGASLVFICAGDAAFREQAAHAARAAGAVVNVVDHPALSDFMTPALVDRGAVVAAVGTSGASPLLAALLRNDLEARIPEGAGRVAALFGGLRGKLREALPDLDDRRAFLREALGGPAAQAAMAGDMAEARRLLERSLDAWDARAPRVGRVVLVIDAGQSDLISLRAARALSQADVLVADDGAAEATLRLARREARRLPPAVADAGALAGFVGAGLQVVWVAGDETAIAAIEAKGLAVERLWPARG
ncbi:MAG TPA: bifunctional precorrin-2 dehydrogenase/sirohydrochlorin ferrochelatase [Caulobacteraceae bacterium]|nr:bifunctional precorrin-2 dehydrogenase/sirohydrochlorin ferrochelatase [Caulobacteraceae bacterium]